FNYVDSKVRDIAYQVKKEIEDYFAEKEGVLPFHWHNINLRVRSMPCKLEYVADWGRKILQNIKGYLGTYSTLTKDIHINQYLLETDNPGMLKSTIKHELMHSIQDGVGTLHNQPQWKYEAEAAMFSVDDFENTDFIRTDKLLDYRNWTLDYIRHFGKKLMTSFKSGFKKLRKYFSEEELDGVLGFH
ncbi:MAG: hypothetical protein ACFFB3_24470, partial [Candidatus Hodarchaeota archaeon]